MSGRKTKRALAIACLVGIFAIGFALFELHSNNQYYKEVAIKQAAAIAALGVPSTWTYQFRVDGTLAEAGSIGETTSPYFWLNSGGRMYLKNGIGMTMQGDAKMTDKWNLAYKLANPRDTDNGLHPQNLFRLVTRSKWTNFTQQLEFKINKLHLSNSPERNAWSGVLLFNRYQDGNNLYYIGVRDDGKLVAKAKKAGVYTTLAEKAYFPGTYNRDTNPTLLPLNQWMGMRSEVVTLPNQTVSLKLYIDQENTGNWELALEVVDTDNPILNEGYAGIRTDYKDVEFDDFILKAI